MNHGKDTAHGNDTPVTAFTTGKVVQHFVISSEAQPSVSNSQLMRNPGTYIERQSWNKATGNILCGPICRTTRHVSMWAEHHGCLSLHSSYHHSINHLGLSSTQPIQPPRLAYPYFSRMTHPGMRTSHALSQHYGP